MSAYQTVRETLGKKGLTTGSIARLNKSDSLKDVVTDLVLNCGTRYVYMLAESFQLDMKHHSADDFIEVLCFDLSSRGIHERDELVAMLKSWSN